MFTEDDILIAACAVIINEWEEKFANGENDDFGYVQVENDIE